MMSTEVWQGAAMRRVLENAKGVIARQRILRRCSVREHRVENRAGEFRQPLDRPSL